MATGEITTKYGPRNYQVQIEDQTHKRHIDQLRGRQAKLETDEEEVTIDDFIIISILFNKLSRGHRKSKIPSQRQKTSKQTDLLTSKEDCSVIYINSYHMIVMQDLSYCTSKVVISFCYHEYIIFLPK